MEKELVRVNRELDFYEAHIDIYNETISSGNIGNLAKLHEMNTKIHAEHGEEGNVPKHTEEDTIERLGEIIDEYVKINARLQDSSLNQEIIDAISPIEINMCIALLKQQHEYLGKLQSADPIVNAVDDVKRSFGDNR